MLADRLRLTIELGGDEVFTGYVSRLAARNGTPSMHHFLEHMDINPEAVKDGRCEAIQAVPVSPARARTYCQQTLSRRTVQAGC